MRKKSYTDDQFIEAVRTSISWRSALKKLNLVPAGGNYTLAQRRAKMLNLSTTHMKGQGSNFGEHHKGGSITPLSQVLVVASTYTNTNALKHRLYKAGLKQPRCEYCAVEAWLDRPLAFHLNHINGIRSDNRLENLEILCPNCHSQTDTYCGRNKNN